MVLTLFNISTNKNEKIANFYFQWWYYVRSTKIKRHFTSFSTCTLVFSAICKGFEFNDDM